MADFRLPRGAMERERYAALIERIEALEARVATLEEGGSEITHESAQETAPDHACADVRAELIARAVAHGIGEETAIKKWPTERIAKAVAKADEAATSEGSGGSEE